jgi:hypothetical protein
MIKNGDSNFIFTFHFLFVFFCLLTSSSFVSSVDSISTSYSVAAIKEKLFTNIALNDNTNIETVKHYFKQLQLDLIKVRNYECNSIDDDTFEFDNKKSDNNLWTQTLKMWSQLNETNGENNEQLISKISKNIDNMCIDPSTLIDLFISNDDVINYKDVFQLILTQLNNSGCDLCQHETATTQITKFQSNLLFFFFFFFFLLNFVIFDMKS